MKRYIISIGLIISFCFGMFLIIRSNFETINDMVTSFPLNYYRRLLGIIIVFLVFVIMSGYNVMLIRKTKLNKPNE